jgi:L,D-peptidoglycan transpeptidase YkuD (ErfK/YbiS/YcfS/YnhG family)
MGDVLSDEARVMVHSKHPRRSRWRLRPRAAGLALGMLAATMVVGSPVAAQATPPPASSTQLLTVETGSPGATTGTLRAWNRVGSGWRLALGPFAVRVGLNGVGAAREGSATTPSGTFPLTEAFGRMPNPGTAMPYFQSDVNDWWDGNSDSPTYNTHVRRSTSPGGASENLYRTGAVYDYAVNIGYNLQRVPGAGSAIFLHVANGSATAGCVSLDRDALVAVLRWMNPAANPHIMIGVAAVRNAIGEAWYRSGGAGGPLGMPLGDEGGLPDRRGIAQWFQGGPIYWSGSTGAHPVINGNLQAWARKGYENGPLGYPTTDEGGLPDGRGIAQWFQGGAVYWSGSTGAHSVANGNLRAWATQNYENGALGYPTTDEGGLPDGRGTAQWFQGGAIYRSPDTGAHALPSSLLQAWIDRGAENGTLGYPVSDPYAVPGGTRIDFQRGSLTFSSATGTVS